jgi:hypothetical protein
MQGFIASQPTSQSPVIASYAPVTSTSVFPGKYLWSVPARLIAAWNDKITGTKWMRSKGLPTVPFIHFREGRFPNYEKMLVMQQLRGSCGATTYIGDNKSLERLHRSLGDPPVRLSPCIDGYTINGHIFILPEGEIRIGYPSLQLVSPTMIGKVCRPLYAGNDFSAYEELIPVKVRRVIWQLLKRLGTLAVGEGYHGILGADLIYNPTDSSVSFLEINPRMQGSTGLLSILEASMGMVPSAARVFISLMGSKSASWKQPDSFPQNKDIPSAQFLLRKGVRTEFPRHCECSMLADESPSNRIESFAVTHRYLTNFAEPTIHHGTAYELIRWAMQEARLKTTLGEEAK